MKKMARLFEEAGYDVFNIDYPSTDFPVEELSAKYVAQGVSQCQEQETERIHFVTHSMGGILVRHYLQSRGIKEPGRVVMLGPPNRGSEVTDTLRESWFYKTVFGPAGQQLGTAADSLVNRLGPMGRPTGVIAGNEAALFDGWFSDIIPGEDDGKVAVERTKVEGMTDFLVVGYSHAFMMQKKEVMAQALHFLRHGTFARKVASQDP